MINAIWAVSSLLSGLGRSPAEAAACEQKGEDGLISCDVRVPRTVLKASVWWANDF